MERSMSQVFAEADGIEIQPAAAADATATHGGAVADTAEGNVSPRTMKRNELQNAGDLTNEEIELVLKNLAEDEQTTLMGGLFGKQTWSRYLVMNYFSKYKWYNPNINNPDAPSLAKGWAYFEHFTLPRRFESKSGGHHIRAPPGEANGTSLYSSFGTPMESLSDWGIGMGMYFSSLYALIIIFILAGLLNIANMMYYSSSNYDSPETRDKAIGLLDTLLRFSTICTDREWVLCAEGCNENKDLWMNPYSSKDFATATVNGEEVTLINRTTCNPATFQQGMINFGTLMLLIVCMAIYNWYLSKREVRFDEDNSSAPDYTLVVYNPPGDAVDPDEWKDFFDQFSEKGVTLVTVALNNEELLNKLVQRRKDTKLLRSEFPIGVECDFDNEESVDLAVQNAKRYRQSLEEGCISKLFTPLLRALGFALTEETIWKRIKKTTEEIKELQQKEYRAAAVYVTFETEDGQRNALGALNASEMEVMTNSPVNIDRCALMHDTVLRVEEASEPNAVRWKDLHYRRLQIYIRLLITYGITFGLICLSGLVLLRSRLNVSTTLYSIILSTSNTSIPLIVRKLVSYEKHYDEGSSQASVYLKITFFRWINAVIVTRYITPILVTLGSNSWDLIPTLSVLLISEMFVSPLLRYFDVMSIIKRHYFAPRAKTEEQMFACFNGGWYNLAERFTDFTKVLLLCTFYSAFYPVIYFLGAVILFIQYWMDKFLLLRSWQKAPNVGTRSAKFSRTYFNTAAVLLGAISSGYAYFHSPFTMLCSCTFNDKPCAAETLPAVQSIDINLPDGGLFSIDSADINLEESFYFCNMDVRPFPPTPRKQGDDKWMTEDQERLTSIYGLTCLILLIVYCLFVLRHQVVRTVMSLFRGVYKPTGLNQHKDFSSGIGFESFGYIPQLEVLGFHFPLLCCNIDDIDVRLIGWKDPNKVSQKSSDHPARSYDNHNLIFDVPYEALHRSRNVAVNASGTDAVETQVRPIFSVIKHYPPEWAKVAGGESKKD